MTATDFAMPVLGGEKVLVVESGEDAASSLTAVLRLNGFNAHTVGTGRAALKASAQIRPRAIIIDLDLPDADPFEIIRLVRSHPEPPFVIVLTGYSDRNHRLAAKEAGAAEYLLKPANPAQLVQLLGRFCEPSAGV